MFEETAARQRSHPSLDHEISGVHPSQSYQNIKLAIIPLLVCYVYIAQHMTCTVSVITKYRGSSDAEQYLKFRNALLVMLNILT